MFSLAFSMLICLMPVAEDPRPFLGIATALTPGPLTADGETYSCGLRVETVQAGSGAEAAGLRPGDVIVAMDGLDPDGPAEDLPQRFTAAVAARKVGDTVSLTVLRTTIEASARADDEPLQDTAAIADPAAFLTTRPAGARLQLTLEKVVRRLTVSARLGQRPEARNLRPLPPNEEIFPAGVPRLDEERLAEALVQRFNIEADYRALRRRLAGLVEQGDAYRLHRVAYALREPFAMPTIAREIAAAPADLPGLLAHAASGLDHPLPKADLPTLRTGLSPEEHARQMETLLAEVGRMVEEALAALAPEERALLEETVGDLSDAFREVVMVLADPDPKRLARVLAFVEAATKVDTARLAAAAIRWSALLDADYLAGLRRDLADHGEGIFLQHQTPWGPIVFAGEGETWFDSPAAVIVDLGGDDFYTPRTQRPLSVMIDFGGDDTHQATFDFAQGGALLGVALLYDAAGDDLYIARRWAQGAAVLGVGLLWDRAGHDTYRGQDYTQSAALGGIGLLIDDAGRDRYEAPRYAQALAMPGGFAALIERGGDDRYFCGGRDLTNYQTPGVYEGMGQGFGIGFRGLASGGIALLLDEAGDDVYFGGNFAQGGGYYFGLGGLVDLAGNDRYLGTRYAQAFAAHQAIGFLEDHAGNDTYRCRQGVGQSCSWDETVTALIDRGGDDAYLGPGDFARCASHNNGVAIMLDYGGSDRYDGFGPAPRASGDPPVTSFSLLLDFGGGADRYAADGLNRTARHGPRHGFFVDFTGGPEQALAELDELLRE